MTTSAPSEPGTPGTTGAESAAWYARARAVFPAGVTHDNRRVSGEPVYLDHAAGSHKWDVDGREYIDYWMGHGALLLGHTPPAIVEAVAAQIARGTHLGGSSPLEVRWGELIQRLVPSAERVAFTSSGTEAVMLALRLARAATGRPKILKLAGHFHGWSDPMTAGFQLPYDVPVSIGVPPGVLADIVVVPPNNPAALEAALVGDPAIAAVILEPTGASYGTVPLVDGYLEHVREITHQHEVLLIFDEVVTGFRYSPGGIQEVSGVIPDLTTLAKILAGGLPGGAVVGRADILALLDFHEDDPQWNRFHRIHHPGTYNANPLSAAAGIAMLESLADGAVQHHLNQAGEQMTLELNAALARAGAQRSCVYGLGSIWHVLLGQGGAVDGRGRLVPGSIDPTALRQGNPGPIKVALQDAMRHRGVDLMSGQVGVLSSAHSEADIAQTVTALEGAVQEVRARLGVPL